jgi:hypothetical protein
MTCPECGAKLPGGTAYNTDAGVGLPDNRNLDCPYCGAPLEPLRWRNVLLLVVVLAVMVAAHRLIRLQIDWKILAVLCVLVVAYHIRELVRWRRGRRNDESQ